MCCSGWADAPLASDAGVRKNCKMTGRIETSDARGDSENLPSTGTAHSSSPLA